MAFPQLSGWCNGKVSSLCLTFFSFYFFVWISLGKALQIISLGDKETYISATFVFMSRCTFRISPLSLDCKLSFLSFLHRHPTHVIWFDFFWGGGGTRPGIKPTSPQQPKPQLWHSWVLNPLSHQGTPTYVIFLFIYFYYFFNFIFLSFCLF